MDDEQLVKIYEAHIAQGASEEEAMRAVDLYAQGAQPDTEEEAAQKRLAGGGSAAGDFAFMAARGLPGVGTFTDELAGLVGGEETRNRWRQRAKDLRQLAPSASSLSEIAGGVAVPVFAGGQAMRTGGGLVRAGVQGAAANVAAGALHRAGDAESGGRLKAAADPLGVAIDAGVGVGAGVVPVGLNAAIRREAGRGGRLAGALRETSAVSDDLLAARNKADAAIATAREPYKALSAANQEVKDPDVMKLLTDPEYQKAVKRVEPEGFAYLNRGPQGQFQPGSFPSMEQLQSIRTSLRGLLRPAQRKGDVFVSQKLQGMEDDLTTAMQKAIPGLADTDKGFAKANTYREAIDEGFKLKPEKTAPELAYDLQGAFPERVEGVRVGAVNRMASDAERGTGWLQRLMSGDEDSRALLRQLYPNDPPAGAMRKLLHAVGLAPTDYEKMIREIGRERSAVGTGENVLKKVGVGLGLGAGYGAAQQFLP